MAKLRVGPSEGQSRLRLIPASIDFLEGRDKLEQSIIGLTKELVNTASQGGIDNQRTVINTLADWFDTCGLSYEIIRSKRRKFENSFLGLTSQVGTGKPPFYLLTACLDTAPFGDRKQWNFDPVSARIDHEKWLTGRGSADSKSGIAIFSHLLADLRFEPLKGTIVFLADSDEHTGGFGAIKRLVDGKSAKQFSGAFIGYPGHDSIKNGARGFYRAKIQFFGTSQHTGSRRSTKDDAILKAMWFVNRINEERSSIEKLQGDFPVPPKITVTSIQGGSHSYSITSDRCSVRVDARLTPYFQKAEARKLINDSVRSVMGEFKGQKPKINDEQSWPAYQIDSASPLIRHLENAANTEFGARPMVEVCGPSNVGNYLASVGVDAVCGFGVRYEGIHAPNERIDLSTIMPVYQSYKRTLINLLV